MQGVVSCVYMYGVSKSLPYIYIYIYIYLYMYILSGLTDSTSSIGSLFPAVPISQRSKQHPVYAQNWLFWVFAVRVSIFRKNLLEVFAFYS